MSTLNIARRSNALGRRSGAFARTGGTGTPPPAPPPIDYTLAVTYTDTYGTGATTTYYLYQQPDEGNGVTYYLSNSDSPTPRSLQGEGSGNWWLNIGNQTKQASPQFGNTWLASGAGDFAPDGSYTYIDDRVTTFTVSLASHP